MIIPIIHYSALEFWLNGTGKNDFSSKKEVVDLPPDYPFLIDKRLAENLAKEYQLSLPISLMAPGKHKRRVSNAYHIFSHPTSLPPKSFVELTDHFGETVLVSSPEYCFLYAASVLPFYEVVRIGCMLCAMYVFDETQVMRQRSRAPITTTKKIHRYLQNAQGVQGIKTAYTAIRYVVDNCNSPMEVSLAVLSALPFSRGGYALEKPTMNRILKLSSPIINQMNIRKIRGDMVWEDRKIVVEYDSNLSHLQKEQHEYDKRRTTAMTMSGYQLIYLTAGQLKSFRSIEETFIMIRRSLGMRKMGESLKRFEDLRREVVHEVLLKKKTLQQILFDPRWFRCH